MGKLQMVLMGKKIDYSYINARLHGLISRLFTEAQFNTLDKTGSITELLHQLREGSYNNLAELYSSTGDIKMVERELLQKHRQVFVNLKKHSPEALKPIIEAFSAELDFNTLKNALRLWFDQSIRKRSINGYIAYVPEDINWNGVTPQQIINAETQTDLKAAVSQAGFITSIPSLLEELDKVFRDRSLFYLELAIDRGFYTKLLHQISELSTKDRTILIAIIGEEIDVRNITRFLRFPALFTKIPADLSRVEIINYVQKIIIPGGSRFSLEKFEQAVFKSPREQLVMDVAKTETSVQVINAGREIITMLNKAGYIKIDLDAASTSPENTIKYKNKIEILQQIEKNLQKHLLKSVMRSKREDPFTIGTLAAYLILKEREAERVQSLINAKYYGLKLMDFENKQLWDRKENEQT